jgi:hypothetical protein
MMKISNWAAVASTAIGVMAIGCTITTSDDADGGLGTGGTGGTTATGGSAGTGGSASVDSGASGGSAGTTAAVDAGADTFVPTGACETCVYTSVCRPKADACRVDTNGCADALDGFYSCLATSTGDSVSDCGGQFAGDAQRNGGAAALAAADLANDLATCVMDLPCVTTCRTAGDGG